MESSFGYFSFYVGKQHRPTGEITMNNRPTKPTDKTIRGHVLAHLLAGNSLTKLQCLRQFGTLKLADIAYDLKAIGYPVETKIVDGIGSIPATGQRVKKTWGVYAIDKKWLKKYNRKNGKV
jgi:hypothetical protein